MKEVFPAIITSLPMARIPFKGIKGWISQAEDHQVVFMEIEPIGEVAPHAHGAQWGIVIEGEMILTIGGMSKAYRKGDHYFIPEDVVHSATFNEKTWVMDFFNEPRRYRKIDE
jgi:quercetin dioxygenase-like cupin family protein